MMSETIKMKAYKRKLTPLERIFSRSPFSIVAVVARITGSVSEQLLQDAVSKVQRRHALLRVRIKDDDDHHPWFTSEGAGEIPVIVVPRESDDHWIKVYHEECRKPFEFDKRPAVRFILVQSQIKSELVIFCHHIICDGMSLAYLARDLMVHLGDPDQEVEVLPDPVPIDRDNMPKDLSLNALFRFVVKRINKKWEKNKIFFDQEDYKNLSEAYWSNYKHQMITIELSESETTALVERCRKEEGQHSLP